MFQNISWSQSLWKWYGGPQTQLRLCERSHQGKRTIRWSISLNLVLFWVSTYTLELASFRRFKSIFYMHQLLHQKIKTPHFNLRKVFFGNGRVTWDMAQNNDISWYMKTQFSLWQMLEYGFLWIDLCNGNFVDHWGKNWCLWIECIFKQNDAEDSIIELKKLKTDKEMCI